MHGCPVRVQASSAIACCKRIPTSSIGKIYTIYIIKTILSPTACTIVTIRDLLMNKCPVYSSNILAPNWRFIEFNPLQLVMSKRPVQMPQSAETSTTFAHKFTTPCNFAQNPDIFTYHDFRPVGTLQGLVG